MDCDFVLNESESQRWRVLREQGSRIQKIILHVWIIYKNDIIMSELLDTRFWAERQDLHSRPYVIVWHMIRKYV